MVENVPITIVLVHRDVRFATVQFSQCETALLQLGLGVVPVLVHDEHAQPREETNLAEHTAVVQVLVHKQSTQEC